AGSKHGSGNVSRDFVRENADIDQFKSIPAAEIIKALYRGRPDRARRSRPHGDCGERLLPHPQRRPRPLHRRSSRIDRQPARVAGGSESPSAALSQVAPIRPAAFAFQITPSPRAHESRPLRSPLPDRAAPPATSAPSHSVTLSYALAD